MTTGPTFTQAELLDLIAMARTLGGNQLDAIEWAIEAEEMNPLTMRVWMELCHPSIAEPPKKPVPVAVKKTKPTKAEEKALF